MKRIHRLTSDERFQQVRREGQCYSDRMLVACVLPNALPHSRFGFSVSKRIGKAVIRNRVRRRLREVIRQRLPRVAPSWDVVLIARTPIAQATYQDIEQACERLLMESSVLVTPVAAMSEGAQRR